MDSQELRRSLSAQPIRWTLHAVREAAEDQLSTEDVEIALRSGAQVVEDYPDAARGACCLVLSRLANGEPLHAVVGYAQADCVVIITVYRPDPKLWTDDFTKRRGQP